MTEDEYFEALAQVLRDKGWQPVWCHSEGGNVWALKDTTGPAPFGQEGVRPSGYVLSFRPPQSVKVFDVDDYDGKHGMDTIDRAEAVLGPLPATWRVTSRGTANPSGRYLYRCAEDIEFSDSVFLPFGLAETRTVKGKETSRTWTDVEVVRTRHRWSWAPGTVHYKNGELVKVYDPFGEECAMPSVDELPWLPAKWQDYLRNPPRPQSSVQFRPDLMKFGAEDTWYLDVEDGSLSSRGQLCDFAFWLMISSRQDQALVIEQLRRVSAATDPTDPWLERDFAGMTDANTQAKTAEYIARQDAYDMSPYYCLPAALPSPDPMSPPEAASPPPASAPNWEYGHAPQEDSADPPPFDPYTMPEAPPEPEPEPEAVKPRFPQPPHYKIMPDAYKQEFARQSFSRQAKLDIEACVRVQQGDEWRARNDGKGGFTNPFDAPPVPDPETLCVTDPAGARHLLVTAGTVTVLYGNRASGKTWVAAAWARQEVTANCHVIWLDFERQASLMKTKLVALGMQRHEAAERFHYSGGGLPPVDYLAEKIREFLKHSPRVLVVIDSFRDLLGAVVPTGDSNSGESVGKVYAEYLNLLHEAGATVCLIDHAPKASSDSTFGSERKESAADNVFKVQMKEKFVLNHSGYSMITCTKDRYGVVPVDASGEPAPAFLWVPGNDDVPKGEGRGKYPRVPELRNWEPSPEVGTEEWEKPVSITDARTADIRSYFSDPGVMGTATEIAGYLAGLDAARVKWTKKNKKWEPGMKVWAAVLEKTGFEPHSVKEIAHNLAPKARAAGLVKDSAGMWSWPDAPKPAPVLGTDAPDGEILDRMRGMENFLEENLADGNTN